MISFTHFSVSLIFLILNDIDFASCTDDNALYKARGKVNAVAKTLSKSAVKLFKRFKSNQMKGDTDRFHLIDSVSI